MYLYIGENVGLYSLYAAAKGANVIAFEPCFNNYNVLNNNIYKNDFSNQIHALNIAAASSDEINFLYLSDIDAGQTLHTFGIERDHSHKPMNSKYKQAVMGMPIDLLISKYKQPFPNHIKIDVDGNEFNVVCGMKSTLKNENLRSISIEINKMRDSDNDIITLIQKSGFNILKKEHVEMFDEGEFSDNFNYLFVRPDVK